MSVEKYRHYADRIKLFNGLKPEEVREILKLGEFLDFGAGRIIFHEGQMGRNLFVVMSGTVDIHVQRELIAKCRTGDAFGEMSVLNHEPHKGTAVARTDVKLFTLDEEHLNQVLNQKVAVRFLLNIIHILSGYVEQSNVRNLHLRRQIEHLEAGAKTS